MRATDPRGSTNHVADDRPAPKGNYLHRTNDAWILAYGGVVFRLRDAKGLHHLACLLHTPGVSIPAIELLRRGERRIVGKRRVSRARNDVASAERARLAVTQRIRAAVRQIAEHDPAFGRHLSDRVRTGTWCAYAPDPDNPIAWEIDDTITR